MKRLSMLMPPTYLYMYLLLAVALHIFIPVASVIHFPVTLLGLIPIALGAGLNVWADRLFMRSRTTVKPSGIPTALMTDGPFRISRHPMYLGFVLIAFGLAVWLGSVTPFVAPVLMYVTLARLFIPQEERVLEKAFGSAYMQYARKVSKWGIPFHLRAVLS